MGSSFDDMYEVGEDQLYIRFGDWHWSETSRNYYEGTDRTTEEGVSVFRADALPGGLYDVWIARERNPVSEGDLAETFYTFRSIHKREGGPVYVLRGELVGWGWDGEPLIQDISIVKEIKTSDLRVTDTRA